MAINTGQASKPYSLPHIANMGFDPVYQVPIRATIAYDGITDGFKRVTTDALGMYVVNDTEDASATITYIGKEDAGGDWMIQKIDTSSGTSIRYATIINNTSETSGYSTAWSDRASLTYGTYSQAF